MAVGLDCNIFRSSNSEDNWGWNDVFQLTQNEDSAMGAWPCEDRLSARRQESHCLWLSLQVIGSDALALLSTLVTNTVQLLPWKSWSLLVCRFFFFHPLFFLHSRFHPLTCLQLFEGWYNCVGQPVQQLGILQHRPLELSSRCMLPQPNACKGFTISWGSFLESEILYWELQLCGIWCPLLASASTWCRQLGNTVEGCSLGHDLLKSL